MRLYYMNIVTYGYKRMPFVEWKMIKISVLPTTQHVDKMKVQRRSNMDDYNYFEDEIIQSLKSGSVSTAFLLCLVRLPLALGFDPTVNKVAFFFFANFTSLCLDNRSFVSHNSSKSTT